MLDGYFIGTLTVILFAAVLLWVAHTSLKGVTALGMGAVIICAVLLPLVDIIRDIDVEDALENIFDGIDYDATDSAIELAFEDAVAQYIADEYGVSADCVNVRADGFDIATLTAQRVYITLTGEGVTVDYKRMEEEVISRFTAGGECEVSISFG